MFPATFPFVLFSKKNVIAIFALLCCTLVNSQSAYTWEDVSAQYGPLPASIQVFKTGSPIDGKPNIAYYVKAKLDDKRLAFTADTTYQRRLTPHQFYEKNDQPMVVVNTTFFSFTTHQNLNVVVRNGRTVAYNQGRNSNRAGDSTGQQKVYNSAIGISKKRKADVAWVRTDSSKSVAYATQGPIYTGNFFIKSATGNRAVDTDHYKKWKMKTAVGGGPVLVQNGEIKITNNEERKFAGKAIDDKHPRTAMGYTRDGYLIILVVEGRNNGVAEGASLTLLAQMLKELGCVEALNLDGGGSSCLLVNGKETIAPSDKTQRAVPGVFIIQNN